MRRVTWRFWAAALAAVAAYMSVGFTVGVQRYDLQIYRWGLFGATVAIVLFVGAWTAIGLARPKSARWWMTDMGTSLVVVTLADLPTTGGYSWVFWFDHGNLQPGILAWVVLSGPLVLGAAVLWRSLVWFRALELRRHALEGDTPPEPGA